MSRRAIWGLLVACLGLGSVTGAAILTRVRGAISTEALLAAAGLLFGAATALQFQLPAMGINVPTAFLLMLPYLLALLAVAGIVGRLEPPTSLTLPFQRGK